MVILGIWDGHDAGSALLVDGRLIASVNEERFSRRKLEVCFPSASIQCCLALARLDASAVDVVAASTSDPAKALGRWFPALKESYYQTRRRRSAPGRLGPRTKSA